MENPTIEHIRFLKKEAENEISKILIGLQLQTTLKVYSVDIYNEDSFFSSKIVRLEIKIEL